MPHDCDGTKLNIGDIVLIEAVVKEIHQIEDYCNLNLETSLAMPPGNHKTPLSLNALQVHKKPKAAL